MHSSLVHISWCCYCDDDSDDDDDDDAAAVVTVTEVAKIILLISTYTLFMKMVTVTTAKMYGQNKNQSVTQASSSQNTYTATGI